MLRSDQLIRTKLHMPFIRSALVSRPRLQDQIARGLCGPLTLIIAPAGFGKTTLVACGVFHTGLPVAWLSLDKNDNQEWRFLSYLIAALQESDPLIGREAAHLLAAAQRATPEMILTSLINDLNAMTREIVMTLDDYQVISSLAVHEEVTFLLDHCPKTFHFVIATRSDPPLPLARLRARGQLVELRTGELRFTRSETAQFMNEVMDLHLDDGAIEMLEDRTEGWIAGLQMAAIAMQSPVLMQSHLDNHASPSIKHREGTRGFIESFSGTHHYIMDFLLEEVLSAQTAEIQRFLLSTSVLERLTAPLCDALLVTDDGDESKRAPESKKQITQTAANILEHLERSNLFLVPLDDERKWYRYHHLFADLLRARLQQDSNTRLISALHSRAALWYEQNNLIYDAIHHASLIPDMEWVERIITQNYQEMFRRMELASIRFLTGSLSREMVFKRPWLCIYEAESAAWFGKLDEADRLLAVAEEHIRTSDTSSDTQAMIGHLLYVKSRITAMHGDIRQAIEICIKARENTPAGKHALLCGIGIMLGYGYFLDGDFQNAIQTLNDTIKLGTNTGVISTTIAAYCVLARLYIYQGRLHQAFESYMAAYNYNQEEGSAYRGGTGIVDVGIAALLYEWNDLEAAQVKISQGMESIFYWRKADDIILAYTTLARIQQAQGNLTAARESIEKASELILTSGIFWEARVVVMTVETRLRLALRESPTIGHLLATYDRNQSGEGTIRFEDELRQITLARTALAQNNLDQCLEILSHLEDNAKRCLRLGTFIEILLLKALAYQKTGKSALAVEVLETVLKMAEPEGYMRVFLDEGEPMKLLLIRWLAHSNPGPQRDYAAHLLAQFNRGAQETTSQKGSQVRPDQLALVDALSQREMEVLHLIAQGKTNQEIASQLVVATGTIKAHAARIYNKLDVANRTEAVARARELKIIP